MSDRWKEGMPDLTFDAVVAFRRFARNHIKPWVESCKQRVSGRRGARPRAGTGAPSPSRKPLAASGMEMQLEIWERESAFEALLREAARTAKRRHHSIDLFRYDGPCGMWAR